MWWISFRGEGRTGIENIGVFEDDGAPRKQHPLLLDPAYPLHIARGFALVGDDLYIADAWRKNSHVARYRRQADTFRFAELVVTTKDVSAMIHPFDVEFGDDGLVYVSSQDSNTVVAILPHTREPAPVAPHLRAEFPNGNFWPGTVVASSRGRLPAVREGAPGNVPPPQGLEVMRDARGDPRRSVRGIVACRRHLFVADEAGDRVKVFDMPSGRLVAWIKGKQLTRPVHLLLHGDTLYIGASGSGSVMAFDIPAEVPTGRLKARIVVDGKLKTPSGVAIGPDGDLYVAERRKRRVRQFSMEGKLRKTFIKDLPDMPEFLVYIPNRTR